MSSSRSGHVFILFFFQSHTILFLNHATFPLYSPTIIIKYSLGICSFVECTELGERWLRGSKSDLTHFRTCIYVISLKYYSSTLLKLFPTLSRSILTLFFHYSYHATRSYLVYPPLKDHARWIRYCLSETMVCYLSPLFLMLLPSQLVSLTSKYLGIKIRRIIKG